VGGGLTPDREALLALRPTVILSAPSIRGLEELSRREGIALVPLKTDTLDELVFAYKEVGRVGGEEARGGERSRALRAELAALRPAAGAPRPRVLLVVGRAPGPVGVVTAAGRGSFLDEVLSEVGGENALAPTLGQWPQVSAEALLASGAEVVVELWPAGDAAALAAQAKRDWGAWPQLEAVKAGRVEVLVGDHLLLPGPRVVETARALKARLGR
jgi:iron complex transport system substrate-binding protein